MNKRKYSKNEKGFTLVELVITIAIVIILSVISVPIYRGYVDKAKTSECYALLGTILSAQKAYYSEYGNFYGNAFYTDYEPVLGVDARGNKYFTYYFVNANWNYAGKYYFHSCAYKSSELKEKGEKNCVMLQYNITRGAKYVEYNNQNDLDSSWY